MNPQIRTQYETTDGQLDPNIAERLLLWVFGKAQTDDLDFQTGVNHQGMLLATLVAEQQFDDAGVDALPTASP